MIQVGKTYKTFGGQNVKIVTGSNNQFTGDNGVWYDKFGRTERGHDLGLIVITVQPAYPDEPKTPDERYEKVKTALFLNLDSEIEYSHCVLDVCEALEIPTYQNYSDLKEEFWEKKTEVVVMLNRVGGSE